MEYYFYHIIRTSKLRPYNRSSTGLEATKNEDNDHVKPVIDDQEGSVVATTRELMPFSNERYIAVKFIINKSFKEASNPYIFSSCSFNLYIL